MLLAAAIARAMRFPREFRILARMRSSWEFPRIVFNLRMAKRTLD